MKEYKCKYCFNTFERGQIGGHTNNCFSNPNSNRRTGKTYEEIFGANADIIKKKLVEAGKRLKMNSFWSGEKELERRKKISETMKANPNAGGLREGSGRGVKTWYTSPIAGKVYLRSSYELAFVKWLDANNIKWKGNLLKFPYTFENKIRYYYPDFYLIDTNEYIEVKGFRTKQDIAKWNNFPHKLKILYKDDLIKIGITL